MDSERFFVTHPDPTFLSVSVPDPYSDPTLDPDPVSKPILIFFLLLFLTKILPLYFHLGKCGRLLIMRRYKLFRGMIFRKKFADIFAAQGAPPVSLTPVANEKKFQSAKI